jgi:hypothetical protein
VDAGQGVYTPAFNRSAVGGKFGFPEGQRERPSMISQGFSFASGSGHNSFGFKPSPPGVDSGSGVGSSGMKFSNEAECGDYNECLGGDILMKMPTV